MSEFHVNVVRLGAFLPHPNADSLDVTKVHDYTVVARRGTFHEGQLAVYVPVDSIVPDTSEWHWLSPRIEGLTEERHPVGQVPVRYRTIEAKRLRGIFSQGCLSPLPPGDWKEGDDVREAMGITKHDPSEELELSGECEAHPRGWSFPKYTSINGLRRYPRLLRDGEEVIVTEKVHGTNARYVHDGDRLWVGSHGQIKKQAAANAWWQVAEQANLEERLARCPWHVFFGEVYGHVQGIDLEYGIRRGARFRAFDVWSVREMRYLSHDDAIAMADVAGIPWVPILYRGPWDPDVVNPLCEGNTTVDDGSGTVSHVREGFVVKPTTERYDDHIGRVILKRHGEGYLLRRKR